MALLEVKNLSFYYSDGEPFLQDICFSIEKGSYVSIIGRNGSGKSTLAKLLIGLLTAKSGEIVFNGVALNDKTIRDIRKQVALVFQNPDNQFIGATVEDDIAFGLENRAIPHENMPSLISNIANEVGMGEFLSREPSQLSGGQKQRVAIAGALVLSPALLILDEATSMLDPQGKNEISRLVHKLRDNNPDLTVLTITHDMEEAFYSDRVIALNEGKVYFDGKPVELFSKEEAMKELGLPKPFVSEIIEKLHQKGIDVQGKTVTEMVEKLCR